MGTIAPEIGHALLQTVAVLTSGAGQSVSKDIIFSNGAHQSTQHTAEFQRHINTLFRELLWDSVLAMVDSVCIAASADVKSHRLDVRKRKAFNRLARRHHLVKPSKATILNEGMVPHREWQKMAEVGHSH